MLVGESCAAGVVVFGGVLGSLGPLNTELPPPNTDSPDGFANIEVCPNPEEGGLSCASPLPEDGVAADGNPEKPLGFTSLPFPKTGVEAEAGAEP